MLVLAGTIPIEGMPLVKGECHYEKGKLTVGEYALDGRYVALGTAAMASAATITCQTLGIRPPYLVTYGDTGLGDGTVKILEYLTLEIDALDARVLTLHYLLPTKEPFIKLVEAVGVASPKPFLIADAIGLARKFDLFTPDPGELSFLADADAAHPAYVQHFIFKVDDVEIARLSKQAYDQGNAPRYLLVKAAVDHIVFEGNLAGVIKEPLIPALEPIGGTGDTITGIVSGLISSGMDPVEACLKAAQVNRYMGEIVRPTPATKIAQLIPAIAEDLGRVL
jgi:hypothetical protein